MKQLIIAALLATAALASTDYEAMFRQFKATHLKAYANEAEEAKRFKAFVENMKKAEVLQAANPHATFGASVYADLTEAEFKTYHNGERHFKAAMQKPRNEAISTLEERKAAAGQKIDWRTKGAVTAVKNQGQCGSCWSFSTTGNIEGQWFLAGNTLTSVSEQELVSCDTIDSGCNGGLMDNAFTWLLQNRGGSIVTEASLPYNSGSGIAPSCPSNLAALPVGATISSYNDVQKTEDAMAAYCFAHGPVAIALDATSFQTYTSGILTNCISQQIDHGVLIVGFDDTNVPPYWIIKNSWGPSWGEAGYIRVAKGSNQCLITSYPTSSIVGGGNVTTAPPGPTPNPPTTAPSGNATFTQTVCTDSACSQGCQSNSFPLNTCLPLNGGGAAIAVCGEGSVTLTEYFTTDCSGIGIPDQMPTNQCLQDTDGTYLENICSSSANAPVPRRAHAFAARKARK